MIFGVLLTFAVVMYSMCKTPTQGVEDEEGVKQSKNVIEGAQNLYHKYFIVTDKDAPREVGRVQKIRTPRKRLKEQQTM